MKRNLFAVLVTSATLSICLSGCGKKADTVGELERTAKIMEKEEPAPAPQAAPQAPQSPQTAAPTAPPAQQVNDALASYKSGNLEDAVVRLQRLRAQSAITPQQRMALQDAMAAVMTDIYARAAQGDARAQQAVKEYERMQNAR